MPAARFHPASSLSSYTAVRPNRSDAMRNTIAGASLLEAAVTPMSAIATELMMSSRPRASLVAPGSPNHSTRPTTNHVRESMAMADATTPSRASVATIDAISWETNAKPTSANATWLPSESGTQPSCSPDNTNVAVARPNRPMVLGLATGRTLIRTWARSASHAAASPGVSDPGSPPVRSPETATSAEYPHREIP